MLRPDTAAFVARLGCAGTLHSAGTHWTAWRTMRRRRLRERIAFAPRTPDGAAAPATASPVHLPQHALTRALRTALAHEKLAEIVTGSRLTDLEQDEHGVSAHPRPRRDVVARELPHRLRRPPVDRPQAAGHPLPGPDGRRTACGGRAAL